MEIEQNTDFLLQSILADSLYHSMEDAAIHYLGIRVPRVASIFFGREIGFRVEKPVPWEAISESGVFSEEEKAAFNGLPTLKRQVEWFSARLAVKFLVQKRLFPSLPLNRIRLGKTEKGAPFLEGDPNHAISLSHGGDWAFCGLSLGKTGKIGLDVERIEKKDRDAFSTVAWSQRESDLLEKASDTEIVSHWTKKEAILKTLGEGFHIPLKKVEILPSGVYLAGVCCRNLFCRTIMIGDDHVLSLAWEDAFSQNI